LYNKFLKKKNVKGEKEKKIQKNEDKNKKNYINISSVE
jgi:hypothetical protein